MWWSKGLILLALAGCGFAPAYGVNSSGAALLGQVELQEPASRDDFDFVAAVEAQWGRAQAPAYDLAYKITTTPVGVAITTDGATTRYTLTGQVDYTLTPREGSPISGSYQTFTGWSATGSTVAGLRAEADAHRRLMQMLADGMVSRVLMALP